VSAKTGNPPQEVPTATDGRKRNSPRELEEKTGGTLPLARQGKKGGTTAEQIIHRQSPPNREGDPVVKKKAAP